MSNQMTEKGIIPYHKIVSLCLLALVATFASLAPGGPLENRDFSHLTPQVFWGFNAFLLSLAAVAIGMIFLTWKAKRFAYWAAIFIAWLYMFVFILDWSGVFPTSPDAMGLGLCLVEIIDSILCFYVVLISHKALGHI